jgi:hypothetical protein
MLGIIQYSAAFYRTCIRGDPVGIVVGDKTEFHGVPLPYWFYKLFTGGILLSDVW